MLQLILLALYPPLVEPSFKLTIRKPAILAAPYPMAIVATLMGIAIIAAISLFFVAPAILGGAAFIVIMTNTTVELIVKKKMFYLNKNDVNEHFTKI